MATIPENEKLFEQFGPHPAFSGGVRLETGVEPDRLVATHCCFCGQQCGIHLKVKDNVVIGFEPREEFPFNQGKLCPKGVKRYLQGAHPDRLLTAYERDPASPWHARQVSASGGAGAAVDGCDASASASITVGNVIWSFRDGFSNGTATKAIARVEVFSGFRPLRRRT